jgi:hypothetical protein
MSGDLGEKGAAVCGWDRTGTGARSCTIHLELLSTQPLEAACRVTYDAAQPTTSVDPAWNPFFCFANVARFMFFVCECSFFEKPFLYGRPHRVEASGAARERLGCIRAPPYFRDRTPYHLWMDLRWAPPLCFYKSRAKA